MTTTEIIQAIKAEIERLMDEYKPTVGGVDELTGAHIVLANLLSFLDTLEKSEKPMNQDEDLNKEIKAFVNEYGYEKSEDILLIAIVARHFCELGCSRTAEKYDEIEYKRQQEEEQTCKGFEEEFRRFIKKEKEEEPDGSLPYYGDCGIYRIARHFAKWGAEHLANSNDEVVINGHKVAYDKDKDAITMDAIPNELEEAAENYSKERAEGHILYDWVHAFKAGAKWDRKQMMKEAVEKTVCLVPSLVGPKMFTTSIELSADELKGFNFGDKVCVIVLPKED